MITIRKLGACMAVVILCGAVGQRIQAADGVDDLVARDARPVELAGDFLFTEGPACDADGNIYFTD